jgi:hypothetical protein
MCEVNCKVQENRSLKTMGGFFSFGDMYPIIRPIRPGVSNSTQHWLCEAWTRGTIATGLACPPDADRLKWGLGGRHYLAKCNERVLLTRHQPRLAFRCDFPLGKNRKKGGSVPLRYGSVPWLRPDFTRGNEPEWPSKNIRVTRGKVALRVASCSDRILFDRQPLIHVEPKSPVGSHVRVDERRQCT